MATHEDANLILKLYELRREEKLRQAREWFAGKFRPQTAQDVVDVISGEHSAYLRMVTSYWEMVAALVNHGTIDLNLFCETTGEQFLVYARIEPFIPAMRTHFGNPRMFSNLEKLVAESPNGKEAIARWQARWAAEAAAAGKNAATA
jgi:hypothetical protein